MQEAPNEPAFGVHVLVSPDKVLPAGNQSGEPVFPALALTPLIVIGAVAKTWQVWVV